MNIALDTNRNIGRRIRIIPYVNVTIFIFVFPLDSAWYMLERVAEVYRIPVGFIGMASSFAIVMPYCFICYASFRKYVYYFLVFLFFSGIAAYRSDFFDWNWVVYFARYLGLFSCGYLLSVSGVLNRRGVVWVLVLSALICIILSIVYLREGWSSEDDFNYLRTANSLIITVTLAIFLIRYRLVQLLMYFGALGGLALISSRTYLYLWLAFPALLAISSQFRSRKLSFSQVVSLSTAFAAVVVSLYIGVVWILPELASLGGGRLLPRFEIFQGKEILSVEVFDRSINMRMELNRLGWEQIKENPIFGYYKGHLLYAEEGGYMHSIVSYWHNFGIVPFLILLYLMLSAFGKLSAIENFPVSVAAKTLMLLLCLAAVASRSYTFAELFFAIGFALGLSWVQNSAGRPGSRRRV